MRIATVLTITLAVILAVATSASARTWHLLPDGSGDAATIQAGINAAESGDIVLLTAGAYTGVGNRDIDFLGKAITVTSESGRDVTIIDCEGLGRGFIFQSGEASSSALSGVTIRNGTAQQGGGICCRYSSSPTISGNTISGNYASAGGGICCKRYSSPTIQNTIIAFGSTGEGLYCSDAWPTLTNCDIYGNVGGDALCGTDGGCNISADPKFCDRHSGNFMLCENSPCVPGHHPQGAECGLIGAFGVGCGPTAIHNTTWGRIKSIFR